MVEKNEIHHLLRKTFNEHRYCCYRLRKGPEARSSVSTCQPSPVSVCLVQPSATYHLCCCCWFVVVVGVLTLSHRHNTMQSMVVWTSCLSPPFTHANDWIPLHNPRINSVESSRYLENRAGKSWRAKKCARCFYIYIYIYIYCFFFVPFIIFAHLLLSLLPTRNSDPASHSRLFSPLPATVRAFIFIARRFQPFSSLVDSHRSVPTHPARRSEQLNPFLLLQI